MPSGASRLIRENAFLAAAVALPLVVAAFFLLASGVPRWSVPPPGFDAVVKVQRPYSAAPPPYGIDARVRDGQVIVVLTRQAEHVYAPRWAVLVVDHTTLRARELPLDLPTALDAGETERLVPLTPPVRVTSEAIAPDGYALRSRPTGGPGLIGEIFGMRGARGRAALVARGRVAPFELPEPFREPYLDIATLGWIVPSSR